MRKLVSVLASFVMLGASVQAQQVTGSVKDQQGKGLEKSTVSLLNAKDSSVVKLAASSSNGQFTIIAAKPGRYLVSASYVGYMPTYSKVFEVSGIDNTSVGELTISKMSGNL